MNSESWGGEDSQFRIDAHPLNVNYASSSPPPQRFTIHVHSQNINYETPAPRIHDSQITTPQNVIVNPLAASFSVGSQQ